MNEQERQAVTDELARRIQVLVGELRPLAVKANKQGGKVEVDLETIRRWFKILTGPED